MTDIYVKMLDFPNCKESEAVTENEDGSYTVFLNSRLSRDRLLDAYFHAFRHITSGDFQKDNVQEIEKEAHVADLVVHTADK